MHSHAHGHDHSTTADIWTKLGAVGETIESFFGNYYFGAVLSETIYDLINHTEEDSFDQSYVVGLIFGLLAIGSVYSHIKLDMHHQSAPVVEEHAEHEHCMLGIRMIMMRKNNGSAPEAVQLVIENSHQENERSVSRHPLLNETNNKINLSMLEKLMLAGDACSHVFGMAGTLLG